METARNLESWFHSQDFDAECRRRRAQQRKYFRQKAEIVADPDDFQHSVAAARRKYFDRAAERQPHRGDPCQELPRGDLEALADTFVVRPERRAHALELRRRGLVVKAKRLLLCRRMGRRVNCSGSADHKFCALYRCQCRYCGDCGPVWFRQKFSEALFVLEPVVEHLLHEGQLNGREIVIAKLDFTIPNTGVMPEPKLVRKFHADLRVFWRMAERHCGISREEYGQAGNDEFGGGNTNLHRHSAYVGPRLPQRHKELSALWSIVGLQGERRNEMLRFIRKHGLRDAWRVLAPKERRFVSIKRARSFAAALAHALKYPAKFLSASTPERLAELEATFHGTRRFSAGGAFYNVTSQREPGDESPVGECPLCGARLVEIVEPWVPIFVLEAEGRRNVEHVRGEIGKARVFSGAGPP